MVTHVQEQEQTILEDLITAEHLPTSGSTCTTTLHFAHKSSANISRHQAIVTAMLSRSAVLPKSAAESMMASAVALIDASDSGFPPIVARVIFLPSKNPGARTRNAIPPVGGAAAKRSGRVIIIMMIIMGLGSQ